MTSHLPRGKPTCVTEARTAARECARRPSSGAAEYESWQLTMTEESTVRGVTYDLLRSVGLTTVFGNPGSTEQTFLQDFPDDVSYILALQEASAIAMADTFAQVTRRPAVVNLHSSAGLGNALGNLMTAYHGNTPLIVTS